jgi:hypothetical protein
MQDEPQLDTRVGYGNADTVLLGAAYGLVNFRMLVDIEDAPDLIEGTTTASPRLAHLLSFGLHRTIDGAWGDRLSVVASLSRPM